MRALILFLATLFGVVFLSFAQQVTKDIQFTWTASTCTGECVSGVDGYRIYAVGGGLIAEVTGTSYLATNYALPVGTDVCFEATAFNADGESNRSQPVCVRVDGRPPSIPILNAIFN